MIRRWKVSIGGLMGLVLFAAIGFAALSHPTRLWAAFLTSSVAALLTIAVLPALFARGPRRAFAAGFGIGGWVCLALNTGPYGVSDSNSLANAGLDFLYHLVGPEGATQSVVGLYGNITVTVPQSALVPTVLVDTVDHPAVATAAAPVAGPPTPPPGPVSPAAASPASLPAESAGDSPQADPAGAANALPAPTAPAPPTPASVLWAGPTVAPVMPPGPPAPTPWYYWTQEDRDPASAVYAPVGQTRPITPASFYAIGHSLISVLAAIVCAYLALRFASAVESTHEPARTDHGSAPTTP